MWCPGARVAHEKLDAGSDSIAGELGQQARSPAALDRFAAGIIKSPDVHVEPPALLSPRPQNLRLDPDAGRFRMDP